MSHIINAAIVAGTKGQRSGAGGEPYTYCISSLCAVNVINHTGIERTGTPALFVQKMRKCRHLYAISY
jgi:hypothetical protein